MPATSTSARAAFFAIGAYTAVALTSCRPPPCRVTAAGAARARLLGLAIGYLTLRLRGVYFSIATLALAVVSQTLIVNWRYVGGSRGAYAAPAAARPALRQLSRVSVRRHAACWR